MKKYALIAALLILMSCLGACMPTKNTTGETTPVATTQPPQQTTVPNVTPGPNIDPTNPPETSLSKISLSSIATPVVSQDFLAEDGTRILTYTYQDIFLIYPDAAVADAVYLSMVNAMSYSSGLQDTLIQAQEAYDGSSDWTAYEYSVLFDTMRIDQTIISVYGNVSAKTSEASSIAVSGSFSLIDGKHLTFGDIQASGYHYYNLLTLVEAQLKASPAANELFEDYRETLASHLRDTKFSNWFFTETGLSFFFLPMEIAPNSEGTIVVEVPYSELTGLVKDDYFPAEEYTTGGSMYAQLFEDAELFKYQQFSEICQNSQGVEFILSTDGAVTDIRLEYGAWNSAGTKFIPIATIFACDGIGTDTAIVVQCDIPDVMPVLRLSYLSAGEQHSQYITQSGNDGAIIFINN